MNDGAKENAMRTEPEQAKREVNDSVGLGWDEAKHPRKGKGDPAGGEFAPGDGSVGAGGMGSSIATPGTGQSPAPTAAGRAAETAETPAEHRAAASYHAMREKQLQDYPRASEAHARAAEANLKAFETGRKTDSMKANLASDLAHQIEARAGRGHQRA